MLTHRHAAPQLPPRIVVLGASGFVGSDLMRHLETLGAETLGFGSAQLDLSEPASIEVLARTLRPDDALVLVSALTPDRGKDIATLMKNLAMGAHAAAALAHAKPAHVVYVSSDAVYAEDANPVTERSSCDPAGFHGVMHLARERMLTATCQAAGVPLAVVRPCAVYGPGDTHGSYGPNRFLQTAREQRRITLFGHGEERRDHLFIADLSRVIGLCLGLRSEGILNAASGRSVSFMALAQQVAGLFDHEVRIEPTPRKSPATHRHFDVAESLRAFPRFRPTALDAGLADTVKQALVLHG